MSGEWMGDPYAAQLRAAKAEGELAAIMDALRDFAEDNGLNPEMEPRDLLAKAAGAFRSCASMSDARYTEIQGLRAEMEAMRPRLMPEGMEWPCFDDGEPVRIGDEYADTFGANTVSIIEFGDGYSAINPNTPGGYVVGKFEGAHGRYVPRPAPKVLDADGVEIREKRDAWWICEGDERGVHAERLRVETIGPNGLIECSPYNGGTWVYLEPSELYVNKPVLAADGKPLEVGQMVYDKDTGDRFEVSGFSDGYVMCTDIDACESDLEILPSQLTHERPVLDADGVLCREGDEVWEVRSHRRREIVGTHYRDYETGEPLILCDGDDAIPIPATCVTHTKPEPPDTRARVIDGMDEETVERIDRLVKDGRWLDD